MSPSGKFFQFNIGSSISFQLRAGFASISGDRATTINQPPGQQRELEGSKKRDLESKRPQQADYYEVIDSQPDESPDSTQKIDSAMISLSEQTANGIALTPTEVSLDNRDADQAYYGRIQRKFADRRADYLECIQSYGRKGQKIVGVFDLPTIDLVI
jgi:hypothetical protein